MSLTAISWSDPAHKVKADIRIRDGVKDFFMGIIMIPQMPCVNRPLSRSFPQPRPPRLSNFRFPPDFDFSPPAALTDSLIQTSLIDDGFPPSTFCFPLLAPASLPAFPPQSRKPAGLRVRRRRGHPRPILIRVPILRRIPRAAGQMAGREWSRHQTPEA